MNYFGCIILRYNLRLKIVLCVHVYSSAATVRKPLKCNILTADVLSNIVWCVLEEKVYTTFVVACQQWRQACNDSPTENPSKHRAMVSGLERPREGKTM